MASRKSICPICTFDGEARHIWLWSFIWENINDPESRAVFIKAGGLCAADNWRLVDVARNVIKSTLGVAIAFRHLTQIIYQSIDQDHSRVRPNDKKQWRFDIGKGCQACDAANNAVLRCKTRLLLACSVLDTPRWLDSAFPLCHPHYRTLLTETKDISARLKLRQLQQESLALSHENLNELSKPSLFQLQRLEASLFNTSDLFPIPEKSPATYLGSTNRCPVCKLLGKLEVYLLRDFSQKKPSKELHEVCLGHFRGISSSYRTLADTILKEKLNAKVQSSVDPGIYADSNEHCPICLQRQLLNDQALKQVIEEQVKSQNPSGLFCLIHMSKALISTDNAQRNRLVQDQLSRINTMIHGLDEFITLHDYRYEKRPAENPDSPYRWALRFLTSEPSLIATKHSVGSALTFVPSRRH